MDDNLVVATPWYPTVDNPYAGSFVLSWLQAAGHPADRTTVIHLENVPVGSDLTVQRTRTAVGTLVRIPVEVEPLQARTSVAEAQRAALRAAAVPELDAADVVHAHVGMPTGWAITGLIGEHVPLFLTEHASYLAKVHRDPAGRRMYAEVVARATRILTVSEDAARSLRMLHPTARDRVVSVGNPVATHLFPLRDRTPQSLDRWLYAGNLLTAKGVDRVIRAFAQWVADGRADARLTLVGGGAHTDLLHELAATLGVADRVDFAGPVRHEALHEHFARADVLVHLSHFETFGLTPIEAAVSGLPVVVTTCGGPTETLADAAAEGLVGFVAVDDDPLPVVAAVRALEGALPSVDTRSVRSALVDRFGFDSFGERVRRILWADRTDAGRITEGPVVVALALSPRGARRLIPLVQRAIRAGARTVLVTNQPEDFVASDPRTRVVDLTQTLPFDPVRLLDRGAQALTRLPVAVTQRLLARMQHGRGSASAWAARYEPAVARMERGRVKLHRAVRSRVLHRYYYGWIDPWRIARSAVRVHGDPIAADGVDVILYGDDDAIPLAWHLARTHLDAVVVGAVSGAHLHDLIVDLTEEPRPVPETPHES